MCGLAGIVYPDKKTITWEQDGPILQTFANSMAHRGPDDKQFHIWKNTALVFRRLSIVDLVSGRQPLYNEDKSLVQITNGEIYNHQDLRAQLSHRYQFRTQLDCEVILPLYEQFGIDYVTRLNGMFATAILDKRRRKLLLVRDRLGIKPLYYHLSGQQLIFASEIKTLLAHPDVPKEFDWSSALTHEKRIFYPQDTPPYSFFKGIDYLPAGYILEFCLETGNCRQHEYWNPERSAAKRDTRSLNAAYYIETYRELLDDAVHLRLMSDVEYGMFLSGGIDSVAIAHLASRHAKFPTFTVLSQSTVINDDVPNAHKAAKLLGLENHQVFFDWRNFKYKPEDWKHLLWMCENPLTNADQLYKYNLHAFAKSVLPKLKVMLLGQGSDEFNGGYYQYFKFGGSGEATWETFMAKLQYLQREWFLDQAQGWNVFENLIPVSNGHLARSAQTKPLSKVISMDFLAAWAEQPSARHPWRVYTQIYRRFMQIYHLWLEDRTAAANSIENRVPFLDHRIVELIYSVPEVLNQELFWDKAILRCAFANELPKEFTQRRKGSFFYGEGEHYTFRLLYNMLRANGNALIEEALVGSEMAGGVLDGDALRRVVDELPNDPDYTNVEAVLTLVNMGLLTKMAKETSEIRKQPKLAVSEIKIDDWETWQKSSDIFI